jgi:diacylglycerol kinase
MYRRAKHHANSLRHALNGIFWVLKSQPNFQFHVIIGILVILFAFVLQISAPEIGMLALTIFFVFMSEMMNTAMEAIVDLVSSEWRPQAKIAKDVSAGMVLTAALCSVVVGIFIFVPYLVRYFAHI